MEDKISCSCSLRVLINTNSLTSIYQRRRRGKREEGRGKREEGRGKREEGSGKWEVGIGK